MDGQEKARPGRAPAGGLLLGLGWGLLVAVADGLPLLLGGTPGAYWGERAVALAYLGVLYGLLGASLGLVLGVVHSASSRLLRRRGAHIDSAAPFVLGALVALTAAAAWGQRFRPGVAGWVVVVLLAAAAGVAVGRLARLALRHGRLPGRALRIGAVALFAAALLAVAGVGLARSAAAGGSTGRAAADGGPANIVLITADGLRPDRLGVYGSDLAITPHLDALAGRGVRFEQAIAPGSWGRPSAASVLTGLYPSALGYGCEPEGGCRWPAPDVLRTTVAEALRAQGYQTAALLASPWLNAAGFRQGFDRFEAARPQEPFDDAPLRARLMGRLLGCVEGSPLCRLYRQGRDRLLDARLIENTGGEAINARAARWLSGLDGEPFFLWVHYDDALPPYNLADPLPGTPPSEGALASPLRRLKNLGYWELGDPFTAREELLPLDGPTLEALYAAEVQRVDRLAGELLDLLAARGLDANTVIVFAGTHGQELFEHGGYTYGHTLYDEVLRVPLIVAGPGVTARGAAVEAAVSLADLAPTLAELGRASLPAEVEGRSLLPALAGQALDERPVFSEALYRVAANRQALRRAGFKLIAGDAGHRAELYDLRADPGETRNLAAEQPDLARAMQDELAAWQARMRQLQLTLPVSPPAQDEEHVVW